MKTFGRVLTAMVTSFNNDGSVNIENCVAIANHLLDNGSDGLVVCGTTCLLYTSKYEEGALTIDDTLIDTVAVSYTHLYVYKRQA